MISPSDGRHVQVGICVMRCGRLDDALARAAREGFAHVAHHLEAPGHVVSVSECPTRPASGSRRTLGKRRDQM